MWLVEYEGKKREWPEAKLRRKLRNRELSGLELARPVDGDGSWRPLYDYSLFGDEVPGAGEPAQIAARRQLSGLALHAVSYVFVLGIILLATSSAFVTGIVALSWGIGLAAHIGKAFPAIGMLRGRTATSPKQVEQPATTSDPFLDQVGELLSSIRSQHRGDALDFDSMRAQIEVLHTKRLELEALTDEEAVSRLDEEVEQVRGDLDSSPDAQTREAHQEHLTAVSERLRLAREALNAARRMRAREQALLHQLEGLRLALTRSATSDLPTPDLTPHLERLQGQLAATEEIDEDLARARRARLTERSPQ